MKQGGPITFYNLQVLHGKDKVHHIIYIKSDYILTYEHNAIDLCCYELLLASPPLAKAHTAVEASDSASPPLV